MPAQNPEEERFAWAGVASRARNMNETTQPEIAVSVPTYARKYMAENQVPRYLKIAVALLLCREISFSLMLEYLDAFSYLNAKPRIRSSVNDIAPCA
jgi:hypothetical protein